MRIPKKVLPYLTLLVVISCVKPKDLTNAADQLECSTLLGEIFTDESLTCSQIETKINNVENRCGKFLTDEEKADLAAIKENCTDD